MLHESFLLFCTSNLCKISEITTENQYCFKFLNIKKFFIIFNQVGYTNILLSLLEILLFFQVHFKKALTITPNEHIVLYLLRVKTQQNLTVINKYERKKNF